MSPPRDAVRIDLNNQEFQQRLFSLGKNEQHAVLKTLLKLSQLSWPQVYGDRSLKWEAILSRKGPQGERLYSLRISQKCRAVAVRDGSWIRLLTLHPDHDSAYD